MWKKTFIKICLAYGKQVGKYSKLNYLETMYKNKLNSSVNVISKEKDNRLYKEITQHISMLNIIDVYNSNVNFKIETGSEVNIIRETILYSLPCYTEIGVINTITNLFSYPRHGAALL